jgi:hypothetical protein
MLDVDFVRSPNPSRIQGNRIGPYVELRTYVHVIAGGAEPGPSGRRADRASSSWLVVHLLLHYYPRFHLPMIAFAAALRSTDDVSELNLSTNHVNMSHSRIRQSQIDGQGLLLVERIEEPHNWSRVRA